MSAPRRSLYRRDRKWRHKFVIIGTLCYSAGLVGGLRSSSGPARRRGCRLAGRMGGARIGRFVDSELRPLKLLLNRLLNSFRLTRKSFRFPFVFLPLFLFFSFHPLCFPAPGRLPRPFPAALVALAPIADRAAVVLEPSPFGAGERERRRVAAVE